MFMRGPYAFRTFNVTANWAEKARWVVLRDKLPNWRRIAVDIRACGQLALLHELLESMLVLAECFFSSSSISLLQLPFSCSVLRREVCGAYH